MRTLTNRFLEDDMDAVRKRAELLLAPEVFIFARSRLSCGNSAFLARGNLEKPEQIVIKNLEEMVSKRVER